LNTVTESKAFVTVSVHLKYVCKIYIVPPPPPSPIWSAPLGIHIMDVIYTLVGCQGWADE
jgi:hypothetical protein